MPFNLIVPHTGKATAKDLIIKELSVSNMMTVAELHSRIKKINPQNSKLSYHAVYQAVKELKNNRVLSKNDQGYSISKEYIKSLHDFVETLEENTVGKPKLNIQPNTSKHFVFNSLNEAAVFGGRAAFANVLDVLKIKSVYVMLHHLWPIHTMKGVGKLQKCFKYARMKKWYGVVFGNSFLDKHLNEWYIKKFNAKTKIGVKTALPCNIIVAGDLIIEHFLPKNLIFEIDSLFNASNNSFDLDWLIDFTRICYQEKYRITLSVTRNSDMASQIKENILVHLNSSKDSTDK